MEHTPFKPKPLVTKLWDLGCKRAAFGIITCSDGKRLVGGWLNSPTHLEKYESKWLRLPRGSGGEHKKCLSCHHLLLVVPCGFSFFLCGKFLVWRFCYDCLTNGRKCKQSDPSYWNCNATLMKSANILLTC